MGEDPELLERALAAVNSLKPRIFSLAQQLVATPSLPGEEDDVQRLVLDVLQGIGLDVEVVPSRFSDLQEHPAFCDDGYSPDQRINVVGRWRGTPGSGGCGRSLILNGHVDVVPPGCERLWDDPPWSGVIRDGVLYGRGSCDMKGGLAAGIFAIAALKQVGFRPAGDVLIESVVGEESGGIGTLATIEKGYSADAALILEPTSLQVCPVQSGALTFRRLLDTTHLPSSNR